ncbi:MAG TPA: serine/threonine-protein kinase [Kofleriaceae bacterium]|nr:serine/threonine-protein kinase [Kofleriaceae bacterium]
MSGPTQGSDPPERPSNPLADTIPASSPPRHSGEIEPGAPVADRYRLGAELGRGGMGRVVEAFDTQLGRTVALKEVLPTGSTNVVRRFQREVQITARLEHASIVPLYDSGKNADGKPFYVMRRVSGKPLDQLIERARGLDERLALLPNVLAAIDAIGHAHKRGVIHRDLKPQNILVGELGETVVIDWGLAKVIGEEDLEPDSVEPKIPTAADSLKTHIGAVFGTPGFMAPEQARGEELDQRGDVYALGATLYQLMAGKPPVSGKSATEMIASTITHKIVPVTRVVPEAPPELVTIIDKALAGDPKHRYANAGELAEDVRRFTTGQLVAAHNYTRWQHMARFARRHRAVLGVAAAASVAVATLAWVSVHRVLTERDAARDARAEAEQARATAEARAVELRQRADDLTLAHVRSLVDTNPTEAIAQLKQLEGSAPAVLDEAKALAKAAITRGVGRGLPTLAGFTVSFDMSADGKRLLQLNREGEMQVVDLDLGRAITTRNVGTGSNAVWVDGGTRILIVRDSQPPQLFEPVAGTLDTIGASPFTEWSVTDKGDFVAYVDENDNLGILDVKTRATTPLWTSGKVMHEIQIARDGSFIAFGESIDRKKTHVLVIDRAGKTLVDAPGRPVAFGCSTKGKLAFSIYEEIDEVQPLAPSPVVARVPIDASESHGVHWVQYHNDTLELFSFRNLIYYRDKFVTRTNNLSDTIFSADDAALNAQILNADDNHVHLLFNGLHIAIPVTSRPDSIVRIAATPSSTRIAATAGDAILVWDIADLVPHFMDLMSGTFVDERHLLQLGGTTMDWHVHDIDTDAVQTIKLDPFGLPVGVDNADDGRILGILDAMTKPPGTRTLMLVTTDRKKTLKIADVSIARLLPAGVVLARDGGHVLGAPVDSDQTNELVRLDGEARSLCPAGRNAYAVLSSAGDLVKGTLDGAIESRTHIDIVRNSFVSCEPTGVNGIVIASGNRLLRWSGTDVTEIARFVAEPAGAIDTLLALPTGLYVELANKDKFFISAQGDHTPRRMQLTGNVGIASHGTVAASISAAGQLELVDLPSLAKWSLPKLATGRADVSVSPEGTHLMQEIGGGAVWRLPRAGRDYGTWLDEITNAELDDGRLIWPWQRTKAP